MAPSLLAVSQVAAGGPLGAVLRWTVGASVLRWSRPNLAGLALATPLVTLAGSRLSGGLAGWLMRQNGDAQFWCLFLGVGVLAGCTTFPTFSLELWLLIERGTA